MTRRTSVLAILVVVAGGVLGCAPHSGAQRPSTPSAQAAIAEATRLNALVEKLYGEGKFREAIPLAEQGLALRERARGPRHLEVAESLNNLAVLYQAQGVYAKAEPLLLRALDIREKIRGPRHPEVAESLNNLATLYQAQGAYAKAEPLLLRALDIREKIRGPRHPEVAESLNNLATLYDMQGAYAKAEPLLVRALDINERTLGAIHPDVAIGLNNLAAHYRAQGAYAKAEPLYLRALDINEKALGAMHPTVATSLNNLAVLYQTQGAYIKAEPLHLRALDIREKVLGTMHPDVATSANNLAVLYRAQGAYAKAEPLYLRALHINEKALGMMHPTVANSLDNLAALYQVQGAYEKVEPPLLRALAIREKVLGTMHPDVAISLVNLVMLYHAQGAYAEAEPLSLRALRINEKALGAMHPNVAISLHNLAMIYQAQGAYAKAEPLYLRALNILEKALGAIHPTVAINLHNLAALYDEQGMYAKAEPLYLRALDINEKVLGGMHPAVATNLNNLAAIYEAQGAYAKAEPLLLRALAIREKALGPLHPNVAISLDNLATFYWAQRAYVKTMRLLARTAEIHETQLRLELGQLSERRKRALMMFLQGETESVVSLHAGAMPSSPQALELALTMVLRRKGRTLDSLANSQLSLRAHLTPALRDKLDQLAAASTELSTRLRAPFDPRTAAAGTSAITALHARINELESVLNAASVEFRVQSEPITVAKIQAASPPGTALVEFVRYHRFDPQQANPWQEAHYIAYVLPWKGLPQAVALGEATTIDAAVDAAIAAMHKDTNAVAAKAALQHLDTLVFAPLRGQLANVSHVILSPDSKLNLVPFEALVDPQGHYELEHRLVSYVTSGRDLLRSTARPAPRSSATFIAAPDYGPLSAPARNGLGAFRPLDGATAEVAELPTYFVQARALTGDQATKAALAATMGPAVLHIATHGFYAREAAVPPAASSESTSSTPVAPTPTMASPPPELQRGIYVDGDAFSSLPPLPPSSEDPTDALDRAGLALAGANVRPDGIVTARELAGYDWWGTQLVVLSACETGVGAVPSGEGVYGMRR
ncbi:MAG TPA: CHAT domain-containing tetratricopeptide repeat protein, partial [Kofleriaceae bacterium]|nr:CHAT domain-containing tetratricopeptide repeat protein [Kofleriaceae bacterium]